MALTFTEVEGARAESGWVRETWYDITLDSSYPTGGEAIDPNNVGLNQLFSMEVVGQGLATGLATTTARLFLYDPYTGKLQAFNAAGSGAIAAHTHDLLVIGGQGAAGTDAVTAPAATDILGKQEAGNAEILGADSATKGGVVAASAGSVAAAAFAEVANGTSLATIRIRVRCTGT